MIEKAVLASVEENGKRHPVEVQYNPSALKLSVSSKPIPYNDPQTGRMQEAVYQNMDNGELNLSFELIVDQDGGRDVLKTVQGLLGMLLLKGTRKLEFHWKDMCVQGEVVHMSASFDLFDHTGAPLRGKVQMEICQCEGTGVITA